MPVLLTALASVIEKPATDLTHLFPTPAELAKADLNELGLPLSALPRFKKLLGR